MQIAKNDLRLRGITVSPANQDFHPTDTRAMQRLRRGRAARDADPRSTRRPVHRSRASSSSAGRTCSTRSPGRFPNLRIVIAQLGQPWVDETICMLGKHPTSSPTSAACCRRPWQAYNALVSCYQHGVIDKLLFGSDFPYTNADRVHRDALQHQPDRPGDQPPGRPARSAARHRRARRARVCSGSVEPFHP